MSNTPFTVVRWEVTRPSMIQCVLETTDAATETEWCLDEQGDVYKCWRRVRASLAELGAAVQRGARVPTYCTTQPEPFQWHHVQLIGISRTQTSPDGLDGTVLFCANQAPFYRPVFFHATFSLADLRSTLAMDRKYEAYVDLANVRDDTDQLGRPCVDIETLYAWSIE